MRRILAFVLLFGAASASESRIINGEDARSGQFPWQAAVASVFPDWTTHLCSGALIGAKWVLTTARCVRGAHNVAVRVGDVDLQSNDVVLGVASRIIVHEYFDNSTMRCDIALIELTKALDFNEKIKPISLAEAELGRGVAATVSGWSHSDAGNQSTHLQYASVSTIDNIECERIYGYQVVTPGVVCTVSVDETVRNPCVGDGGALLVTDVDTNPVLAAMFSFIGEPGCETGIPAGYTRIAYYTDWIGDNMQ